MGTAHRTKRNSVAPGAARPTQTRGPAQRGGTSGPTMLPAPRRHRLPGDGSDPRRGPGGEHGRAGAAASSSSRRRRSGQSPERDPHMAPPPPSAAPRTRPFQRAAPGEAAAAQVPPAPPRPDPAPHPPRISGSSARCRRAPPGASVRPREKRPGTKGAFGSARFWHPQILFHGAACGRYDRQDPALGRVGPHPVGLCPALSSSGGAPAAPCLCPNPGLSERLWLVKTDAKKARRPSPFPQQHRSPVHPVKDEGSPWPFCCPVPT